MEGTLYGLCSECACLLAWVNEMTIQPSIVMLPFIIMVWKRSLVWLYAWDKVLQCTLQSLEAGDLSSWSTHLCGTCIAWHVETANSHHHIVFSLCWLFVLTVIPCFFLSFFQWSTFIQSRLYRNGMTSQTLTLSMWSSFIRESEVQWCCLSLSPCICILWFPKTEKKNLHQSSWFTG